MTDHTCCDDSRTAECICPQHPRSPLHPLGATEVTLTSTTVLDAEGLRVLVLLAGAAQHWRLVAGDLAYSVAALTMGRDPAPDDYDPAVFDYAAHLLARRSAAVADSL